MRLKGIVGHGTILLDVEDHRYYARVEELTQRRQRRYRRESRRLETQNTSNWDKKKLAGAMLLPEMLKRAQGRGKE